MRHYTKALLRAAGCVTLWFALTPAHVHGQAIKAFNNTNADWLNAASWTPSGVPNNTEIALFAALGTTGGVTQPTLNGTTTVGQLYFSNTAFGQNRTLSGTGSLTAGSASFSGINTRGTGTYTVDLGNGSATSLVLTGPGAQGTVSIGSGSTLVLGGNTVATTTGATDQIINRGGTLVLDNSGGNPVGNRLTLGSSGGLVLQGAGAKYEFRGSTSGTFFDFTTTGLLVQSGDTTVRVVQPAGLTSGTTLALATFSHSNTFSTINFASSGPGTLGGGLPTDPYIRFNTGTPPAQTFGVISQTNGSGILGFALYNNTHFASYDNVNNGGVIPASSSDMSGTLFSSSGVNVNLVGSANTVAAAS